MSSVREVVPPPPWRKPESDPRYAHSDDPNRNWFWDGGSLVRSEAQLFLEHMDSALPEDKPVSSLKAIETSYKGYRFRSRLEARWAVFFDALRIDYRYEDEGYDLGDGIWYLPDFWLPSWDCYVEIKGKDLSPREEEKAKRLSERGAKPVFVIRDVPGSESISGYGICGGGQWLWRVCSNCGEAILWLSDCFVSFPTRPDEVCSKETCRFDPDCDSYDKIKLAYTAARSERFGR